MIFVKIFTVHLYLKMQSYNIETSVDDGVVEIKVSQNNTVCFKIEFINSLSYNEWDEFVFNMDEDFGDNPENYPELVLRDENGVTSILCTKEDVGFGFATKVDNVVSENFLFLLSKKNEQLIPAFYKLLDQIEEDMKKDEDDSEDEMLKSEGFTVIKNLSSIDREEVKALMNFCNRCDNDFSDL